MNASDRVANNDHVLDQRQFEPDATHKGGFFDDIVTSRKRPRNKDAITISDANATSSAANSARSSSRKRDRV